MPNRTTLVSNHGWPRSTRAARLCTVLLVGALPGCWLVESSACDAYAAFMLAVNVTDARTAEPIAFPFTLAVFSAERGDSLVLELPPDPPQPFTIPEGVNGAWGPGRYSVEVRASGYRTWRRDGILVEEAGCGHTKTRTVDVTLEPL